MTGRCFLAAAAILAAALPARAQTSVYETAKGSWTTTSVLVYNNAITQIDVSTRAVRERFTLEVWNDDSASNLWCSGNVNVSSQTTTVGGAYGRRVPARTSWTVAIPISAAIYCVSDAVAGVVAVFTQLW